MFWVVQMGIQYEKVVSSGPDISQLILENAYQSHRRPPAVLKECFHALHQINVCEISLAVSFVSKSSF